MFAVESSSPFSSSDDELQVEIICQIGFRSVLGFGLKYNPNIQTLENLKSHDLYHKIFTMVLFSTTMFLPSLNRN
jgi:hypothetical protein